MKRLGLVLLLIFALLLHAGLTRAVTSGLTEPAWANPNVMALKKVSAVGNAQNEPNFLSNLDCSLLTYRLVADSSMRTGCFTAAAFGLIDSDSETVIFNGTDEGLPLFPYSPHQVLIPWPGALDLVVLDAVNTGGSYISLYKNPMAQLQDQRNPLAQLTAKQLTAPPELALKDGAGQRLVVNPQTMAFSDGGSWLVVETLTGSFVRINLATLDITAFAPSFGTAGSPGLLKSRVAISDNGRYVAIQNDVADSLKVYDLSTCTSGSTICQSYDYQPFIKAQINGLQSIRHLRFINDGLLSFETITANSSNADIYELAPTDSITSLTDYIGLGDSYTSGEGAFDYLAGTDTEDNVCHLSRNSYPLLLTHDLFSSAGGHSVACSGAAINDVGSTSSSYKGQVRGIASLKELQQSQPQLLESVKVNFVPGYIAQQRFVKRWQPRVMTVSVGGNDVGFGDLMEKCVIPHVSIHISDNTCYNTYEDRLEVMGLIDRTVPRWTALYKQLSASAPRGQLYAIGYPEIFDDTGSCAVNVNLSKSELEFAEELIAYLNGSIQQAASQANVPYIDISKALAGHRLCETSSYNVAVNGLTAGKDNGFFGLKVFGKESYHPNALGHTLIEQAILKQTHNLTLPTPSTPTSNTGQTLLNVPKSGRVTNNLVPATLTSHVISRNGSLSLSFDGSSVGLRSGGTYIVHLDGSNGLVLATINSNSLGNIATVITIPASISSGEHTIDITGQNQIGEPIDLTQPVYVPSSPTDSDGDGIIDSTDSCPATVNSGQDVDQDGIDDSCDDFINQPPSGNSQLEPPPAISSSQPSGITVTNESSPDGVPLASTSLRVAQLKINTSKAATVSVLGERTINPNNVRRDAIQSLVQPTGSNKSRRQNPGVINWLPWILLPTIAWWLVLLLIWLLRTLIEKKSSPSSSS